MKATDLPDLRRRVLRYLTSPRATQAWRQQADDGTIFGGSPQPLDVRGKGDLLRQQEVDRWRMAELFYVTEDMTTLAMAAGESLPTFALRREDLPTEFGVIYFSKLIARDGGPETNDTRVCTWGLSHATPHNFGVWLSLWTDTEMVLRFLAQENIFPADRIPAIRAEQPPIFYAREAFWEFSDGVRDDPQQEQLTAAMRAVRAAWLLMVQEVASVRPLQPRRADLRLARRRKLDLTRVRVVSLRHRSHVPCGPDGSSREYAHRWIVRGHWRKQWYPSQQRHVPIWIQAHVKGPEGAPMLTGDVVNVWRR